MAKKILFPRQNNSKAKFTRPEGAGNFDNMDDHNIVQTTSLRQGTIQHIPNQEKDIVNKKYVDDNLHPQSHTIASHSDTSATGTELNTLTDNSMADTLHRHSELSASDGDPDKALYLDATGKANLGTAANTHVLNIGSTTSDNILRIIGTGAYGSLGKLNFGDADYVHISEVSDDNMEIKANSIDLKGNVGVTGTHQVTGVVTHPHAHSQPARSLNTTYRNTTGHPIMVYGSIECFREETDDDAYFECKTNASTPPTTVHQKIGLDAVDVTIECWEAHKFGFFFVVQNNHYYRIDSTTSGTNSSVTLLYWNEVNF